MPFASDRVLGAAAKDNDGPIGYAPGMFEFSSCGFACHRSDLPSRTSTPGAEYALVAHFLDERLAPTRPGEAATIFIEPKIDSAFPDIVVAYWNADIAAEWPSARRLLSNGDLKHVQYLHMAGQIAVDDLERRIGKRPAARLVAKLVDAELAGHRNGVLRRKALKTTFAIRRLVAIEAKMSNWKAGLHQAFLNSWFASETFLLLPDVPKAERLFAQAKVMGVGVVSSDQDLSRATIPSPRGRLPKSYASWYFNEWAWRYTLQSPV